MLHIGTCLLLGYISFGISLVEAAQSPSTNQTTIQHLENFWNATNGVTHGSNGTSWDYVALRSTINETESYSRFSGVNWNFEKEERGGVLEYRFDPCDHKDPTTGNTTQQPSSSATQQPFSSPTEWASSNEPSVHWVGINCEIQQDDNMTYVIDELALPKTIVHGTLPDVLGLPNLTYIDLSCGKLTGGVPDWLKDMTKLITFDLHDNSLTGTIPEFSNSLQDLDLSTNNFTGKLREMPTSLTNLHLEMNSIEGSLGSLSKLTALVTLNMSHNRFDSTLPELEATNLMSMDFTNNFIEGNLLDYSDLESLQYASFSQNLLSGSLPSHFMNLTSLMFLDLSFNNLNGPIPGEIKNLTSISTLNLCFNSITGPLPMTMRNLVNLENLFLLGNKFEGPLDPVIPMIPNLSHIDLSHNMFSGNLANWTSLTKIRKIIIRGNDLSGELPSYAMLETLVTLDLNGNKLTGKIPTEITHMTNLATLDLGSNAFSGTMSTLDYDFTLLQDSLLSLNLSSNNYHGSIPEAIQKATSLQKIDLSNNRYSGKLPNWSKSLKKLREMYLQKNLLTGAIEEYVCSISSLEVLDLSNNLLVGKLPQIIISLMPNLRVLDLTSNSLSGKFPTPPSDGTSTYNFTKLVSFSLRQNSFTGPFPDFGSLLSLQIIDIANNQFTGNLPDLSKLSALRMLTMEHNLLTTPIELLETSKDFLNGLFNEPKPDLFVLDASFNTFSGHIDPRIFNSTYLSMINLAGNCFSGVIPESICSSKNLESISLGELTAGESCRSSVWDSTALSNIFDGFRDKSSISGVIPSCIFSLPNLITLRLSGNGIPGTLPEILGSSLKVLDASHNRLHGTIPKDFFSSQLEVLDLSSNWLSGDLSFAEDFVYTPKNTVYLQSNRLSGRIPLQISNLVNVEILEGNIFECNENSILPSRDPKVDVYTCSFNSYTSKIITFGVICIIVLFAACRYCFERYYRKNQVLIDIIDECYLWYGMSQYNFEVETEQMKNSPAKLLLERLEKINKDGKIHYKKLQNVVQLLQRLRDLFVYVGGTCAVLFLLIYLILASNRTMSNTYIFVTTAGYLTGSTATIICTFFFLLTILSIRDIMIFDKIRRKRKLKALQEADDLKEYRNANLLTECARLSADALDSPSTILEHDENDNISESYDISNSAASSPSANESIHVDQSHDNGKNSIDQMGVSISNSEVQAEEVQAAYTYLKFLDVYLFPLIRIIIVIVLGVGINVTVNGFYVYFYLTSSEVIQNVLAFFLAFLNSLYPTLVEAPLFGSRRLMFKVHKSYHTKFVSKFLFGDIAMRIMVRTINSILTPMLITGLMDQSCFHGFFIAPAPRNIMFSSWFCNSFDVEKNICLDVIKTSYAENIQSPFIYNYACTPALLQNYIPVYAIQYLLKLVLCITKFIWLLYYGVERKPGKVVDNIIEETFHPQNDVQLNINLNDEIDEEKNDRHENIEIQELPKPVAKNLKEVQPDSLLSSCWMKVSSYLPNLSLASTSVLFTSKLFSTLKVRKKSIGAHPNDSSVVKVNAAVMMANYLSNFLFMTAFSILAPLLTILMITAVSLEILVDQLVIGRFLVVETSTIIAARSADESYDNRTPFDQGRRKKRIMLRKTMSSAFNLLDIEDEIDAVDEPYGAIAALNSADDNCSSIKPSVLTKIKVTYVIISSILCAFVVNDIYNSGEFADTSSNVFLAGGLTLCTGPLLEFFILIAHFLSPGYFEGEGEVTEFQIEEFKIQQRNLSTNRAFDNINKNRKDGRTSPHLSNTYVSPFHRGNSSNTRSRTNSSSRNSEGNRDSPSGIQGLVGRTRKISDSHSKDSHSRDGTPEILSRSRTHSQDSGSKLHLTPIQTTRATATATATATAPAPGPGPAPAPAPPPAPAPATATATATAPATVSEQNRSQEIVSTEADVTEVGATEASTKDQVDPSKVPSVTTPPKRKSILSKVRKSLGFTPPKESVSKTSTSLPSADMVPDKTESKSKLAMIPVDSSESSTTLAKLMQIDKEKEDVESQYNDL